MPTLNSSNLASADFDDNGLVITFKSGSRYRYPDATRELFEGLVAADSAGKFFAAHVRSLAAQRLDPTPDAP